MDHHLLRLNQRILENIFSNLPSRDLSSLRLTCQELKTSADEFLRHFSSIIRNSKAITFPAINHCWEFELLENLKESRFDALIYKHRNFFKDTLIRKPVIQADDFPHLGNDSYITAVTDAHLERSVVQLKSVCWLYCSLLFHGVRPGVYLPSIVIRLLQGSFDYPSYGYRNAPDIFVQVKSSSDDELLSEGRIPVKDLKKWTKKTKRASVSALSEVPRCSSCPKNEGDAWFYYHLPQFKLTKTTDLNFLFHDTQNHFWKSGIEWDFFQLKKVN